MRTCTWTFLGRDSSILSSVEVALLDENNRSIFWFKLGVKDLLSLLNGNNLISYAAIDVETPEGIIDYAQEVLGDKFDAETFFEQEVVVRSG